MFRKIASGWEKKTQQKFSVQNHAERSQTSQPLITLGLTGGPFEEILAQSERRVSQPADDGQIVTHLLDELHLLLQELVFKKGKEVDIFVGRGQGLQLQKVPVQALF